MGSYDSDRGDGDPTIYVVKLPQPRWRVIAEPFVKGMILDGGCVSTDMGGLSYGWWGRERGGALSFSKRVSAAAVIYKDVGRLEMLLEFLAEDEGDGRQC